MSVVVGDRLFVKGAPDALLDRCDETAGAAEALEAMANRGLRVLAVATRPAADIAADAPADAAENDLELLGLLGLEDPPRPSAAAAIAACRHAGIRVAMVTGDHPATARAIAAEVGLSDPGGLVLEGKDLPADEQVLGALLDRDGVVLARVAPEDKLRIARALQARGHVVAMTGDGVNDGPALQEADIGIAMGRSGTDVAREAADLVLLDDDFATIVAAVEQGRATFSNVHRFLTYHLTDNVAELTPFVVWALSGGRFPLALGVLQILCLDIGTDLLPALALGAEPPNTRARGPAHGSSPHRRGAAAPGLRRARSHRGRDGDDRVRRRLDGRRLATGRELPDRARPPGRLRRRVRRRGHRPGRQRLRLPQRHPLAGRAGLDREPAPARRRRGRAGRPCRLPVDPAGGLDPRPRPAPSRRARLPLPPDRPPPTRGPSPACPGWRGHPAAAHAIPPKARAAARSPATTARVLPTPTTTSPITRPNRGPATNGSVPENSYSPRISAPSVSGRRRAQEPQGRSPTHRGHRMPGQLLVRTL